MIWQESIFVTYRLTERYHSVSKATIWDSGRSGVISFDIWNNFMKFKPFNGWMHSQETAKLWFLKHNIIKYLKFHWNCTDKHNCSKYLISSLIRWTETYQIGIYLGLHNTTWYFFGVIFFNLVFFRSSVPEQQRA